MIRIRDLTLTPDRGPRDLRALAARELGIDERDILELKIRRRSIDARKKPNVYIIYTVDVSVPNEQSVLSRAGKKCEIARDPVYVPPGARGPAPRPVVVGFGPGGMFAALILAEAGMRPIVLERGEDADSRTEKVRALWERGELDPESNVQFGEGGAGTFSDGKLTTGTKDIRIGYVFRRLCEFGADESILYDAKPHIGTDVLRSVVKNLRSRVIRAGGEVRFRTAMTGLRTENGRLAAVLTDAGEIPCNACVLAIGHSARDTFRSLLGQGIAMEPKPFSMGVRIEHRQGDIDLAQYGLRERSSLPPADYKLNCRFPEGDSAYTFCMCPGGYVVAAASQKGGVCTYGMSEHARDGQNANAALLVTLSPEDVPYPGPLGGAEWQEELERRAYEAGGGGYAAPVQRVGDFLAGRPGGPSKKVVPTYRPGVKWCDLNRVLPERLCGTLRKAIPELGRRLRGFDDPEAVLTAVEARSSSPVRIIRDGGLQSPTCRGLFPCGEGAGYAGGIVSAAVDGIRCAEKIVELTDSPAEV